VVQAILRNNFLVKMLQERLAQKGTLARFAMGSFWSLIGNIFNRASGLILAIAVARIVGPNAFGEFSIVRSTIMTMLTFGGAGLSVTATKYIAETRIISPSQAIRYAQHSEYLSLCLAALISGLLLLGANQLATVALGAPSLTGYLQIAALAIFFNAINSSQIGVLSGFESFRLAAFLNIANGIFGLIFVILGAFFFGATGAVIGVGIAALAIVILSKIVIDINLIKKKQDDRLSLSIFLEMLKFSIPITLSGILVSPILWSCNAMLVRSQDGLHQVALFEAANQWRMLILFVPLLVAQVSLPILSSIKEKQQFRYTLKMIILATLTISAIVALPVFVLSRWLMTSYGASFQSADVTLKWLAISSILIAVNNVIGQAIASQNKAWHGLVFNLIWAAIILFGSWHFIKNNLGAEGLAIAQTIAYAIHTVVQVIYAVAIHNPQRQTSNPPPSTKESP